MSGNIKAGDWVTVVQCCKEGGSCGLDVGLQFKVGHVIEGMGMITCDGTPYIGLVPHPDLENPNSQRNEMIPVAWLRRVPPDSECKGEDVKRDVPVPETV